MLADVRIHRTLLAQRNLHHVIVQELGRRIIQGDFQPGDSLPSEIALSAEFGVSRTVLREANHILAEKGLVESRPKTGTRVRLRKYWNLLDPDVLEWAYLAGPDLHFLKNLNEVRQIIEPAAAELAAQRASADEIALIGELLERMEAAATDPQRYIDADLQFHAAILAASHNELLEQMTRSISVALTISRRITVQLEGGTKAFMAPHHAIYDAIRARDAVGARAAMSQLIASTAEGMRQVLQQGFAQ